MPNPEWDNYDPKNFKTEQEKTPSEHLAVGASNGEEVLFTNCPNCKSVLAAYIRIGKAPFVLGPIEPVRQEPLSTDDR